jgi:ribA/ribD-fused uncharacterized protein
MSEEIRFYRATGEYGFLSNLYKRSFVFETREWTCREQAYQYGKPRDKATAEWIAAAPKPHLMAIAAHGLFSFDVRSDWNQVKVERMRQVIAAFFKQNEDLAISLASTNELTLVEASKSDGFWGLGRNGKGKNMLGQLLMECRANLVFR